jgi:hypothetical protein
MPSPTPKTTTPAEPFPARIRRKRRAIGPFSKRLSFAQLDLRTAEGQYADDVRTALTEGLGHSPSPAQQILIQMAALKLLRCELLCRQILSAESIQDRHDHHFLAWSNSVRRDLEALSGLRPAAATPVDPMQALSNHLEAIRLQREAEDSGAEFAA